MPPGAEGLVVRDDWQGNRSPYKNPQARGAIAGLVAGPRSRPRLPRDLRGDRLRHAAHPRRRLGPRPQGRADLPGRRRGQVGALAPDPRRHPQEARPSRPRERGVCPRLGDGRRRRRRHLSRLRPGRRARWSPSRRLVEPNPGECGGFTDRRLLRSCTVELVPCDALNEVGLARLGR